MSGQTGAWSPDAETLIRGALRHEFEVKVYPEPSESDLLPIDVIECSLTYDEFWSPYVQGELTAVIPDADTLAYLDPRQLVRVDVYAGYVLPGGVRDVHLMACCYLSGRSIDYPANELRLSFQGPEYVIDAAEATMDDLAAFTSESTAYGAVDTCLTMADYKLMPIAITNGFDADAYSRNATGWVDPAQDWLAKTGDNWLNIARDIADRVDAWFRCDETGWFRLTRREWGPSIERHKLRVGADGTIISASDSMSRDGWANSAQVHYSWSTLTTSGGVSTAVPKQAIGAAELNGSDYDPDAVGAVFVRSTRPFPSTKALAQAAAASLLRRYSVRAKSLSLSAVAAYWLRPPMGVTVELPVGAQQRLNVSAITFDLVAGRMDIRTRHPGPGLVQVPTPPQVT